MTEQELAIARGISDAIELETIAKNFKSWWSNTAANLRQMQHIVPQLTLPEKGDTVFIVGPGASIHQYKDELSKLSEHGLVIAQPTAYPFMHTIGLEPDLVVVADKSPKMTYKLRGYTGPVICPTTVDPGLAQEHDCYFFTLYQGDGTPNHPRFGLINSVMHWLNRGVFGAHGWVSLGDVTNMAVQIAWDYMQGHALPKINAKRIVLVGIDRCFWKGLNRVRDDAGEPVPRLTMDNDIEWRERGTTVQMVMYQERLYRWWRMFAAPLYRLDHGIQTEIPFVHLGQIENGKYPKPLSREEIENRVDPFLTDEFLKNFPYQFAKGEDAANELLGVVNEDQTG